MDEKLNKSKIMVKNLFLNANLINEFRLNRVLSKISEKRSREKKSKNLGKIIKNKIVRYRPL